MSQQIKINVRSAACKCGCHGRDPQHKKSFTRNVRNIREEVGTTRVDGVQSSSYRQRALARLPWGESVVVLTTFTYEGRSWDTEWWFAPELEVA